MAMQKVDHWVKSRTMWMVLKRALTSALLKERHSNQLLVD